MNIKSLINKLVDYASANPVRTSASIASVVVFVATQLGIVVDQQSVAQALLLIIPVLVSAEVSHRKVSPVNKGE